MHELLTCLSHNFEDATTTMIIIQRGEVVEEKEEKSIHVFHSYTARDHEKRFIAFVFVFC